MIAHIHMCGPFLLPAHKGIRRQWQCGHKQISRLLEVPGWAPLPPGPCSVLLPWIMSDRVLLCPTAQPPLWRESCWGAYVLCDAWLHWQTCAWPCIHTHSNPLPSSPHVQLYTPGNKPLKHILACMHTNINVTNLDIHALTRIDQCPAHSHLDLLLNKIAVSPAALILPAPSTEEASIP